MNVIPFPRHASPSHRADVNGLVTSTAAFEETWLRLETVRERLHRILRSATTDHGREMAAAVGAEEVAEHARLSNRYIAQGIDCAERTAGLAAAYDVFSLVRLDAMGSGLDCLLRVVPFAADVAERGGSDVPVGCLQETAQRIRFEILRTVNAVSLLDGLDQVRRETASKVIEAAHIALGVSSEAMDAINLLATPMADAVTQISQRTINATARLAFFRGAVDLAGGLSDPVTDVALPAF